MRNLILMIVCLVMLVQCTSVNEKDDRGFLVPFVKNPDVNPCLEPSNELSFVCPVLNKNVSWEEKDVFNPACVVKGDTLFLLYRAEDILGKYQGTSRIGLAYSLDGYHFTKEPKPVLFPENDDFKIYEWEGGCEDPRLVEGEDGRYYLYYTAYDGDKARLFVASSVDLRHWTKYGSIFKAAGDKYVNMWSKAGAVVCQQKEGQLMATKIKGKYWMFWGESNIYMATSENLVDWEPVLETDQEKMQLDTMRDYTTAFKILFSTREGKFDSELVEPGPPAVITEKGILFIYNSKNSPVYGDKNLAPGTYAAGQIILDENDPTRVIDRMEDYFITPDQPYEITGQVNNVCFVEGLAYFRNKWLLYYGTADSKIAVAESAKSLK